MLTSISTSCEQVISKVCSVTVTAGRLPLLRPNLTVSRLTKTVWTKAAKKRGKSVQKLSTDLASTCHRISKTTVQSYIKLSRGLKAYWRSQQPKISENSKKGSCRPKKHLKAPPPTHTHKKKTGGMETFGSDLE